MLNDWFFSAAIFSVILTGFNSETQSQQPYKTEDFVHNAKDAAENMLATQSGLDQYMRAMPYTIALLGHLMLVATQNDFKLTETTAKNGFKRLKYPNSFRASLVQLTNIGWEAYNEAHVNMDSIRLLTSNIDSYVQTLVKVMGDGSQEEIDVLVPLTLNKIKKIADECLDLSSQVEDKFIFFMETIGELLEGCTVAHGVYEKKSKEAEMAIKAAKNEKIFAKQEKRELEYQYEKSEEERRRAQEDFNEKLNSEPSTTKMFGLRMLDGIWGFVQTYIPWSWNPVDEQFREHYEPESEEDRSRANAFKFAENIERHIKTLVDVTTSGKEKGQKEPNFDKVELLRETKHSLLIISKNLNTDSVFTDIHQEGIRLCNDAVRLCEQLVELGNDMKPQQDHITAIIIETEDLLLSSKQFSAEAMQFLLSRGPRMKRYGSTVSSSFFQSELTKYQVNIEVAKDILKDSKKKQEELIRSLKKNNARMEETLRELTRIEIKKVDFAEIRKTLQTGLLAMQEVRKQWGLVVAMFQTIAKTVKLKFRTKITDLVDIANIGLTKPVESGLKLSLLNKLFFDEVFRVSKMTYAVHTISSTYVEISSKYLIEDINSLGGLIALDPRTQQQEIEKKRRELNVNCQRALNEIGNILLKNRQEYTQKIEKKLQALSYNNP